MSLIHKNPQQGANALTNSLFLVIVDNQFRFAYIWKDLKLLSPKIYKELPLNNGFEFQTWPLIIICIY